MVKPVNRVHTMSRWPKDPMKRIALAELDTQFVESLRKCGIRRDDNPILNRLVIKAATERMKAEKELRQ